jgi:hypothetical protein
MPTRRRGRGKGNANNKEEEVSDAERVEYLLT